MTRLERSRGLGTPLAALLTDREDPAQGQTGGVHSLIPGGRAPRPRARPHPALRADEAAFVALDLLERAFRLDLAAYLHRRDGRSLQSHLRAAPSLLSSEDAAFALSDALVRLFETAQHGTAIVADGLRCLSVPTHRHGARGLYVVGRRSSLISGTERESLEQVCELLGDPLHRVH
jgi:hypothetical protein